MNMIETYTEDGAKAAGYATFNRNDTLCVDVPDGGFTISAKTSEGKRITFSFQPYRNGGPAQCVDVCYHDSGMTREKQGDILPLFNAVLFGETAKKHAPIQHDTREQPFKPHIVCVLMDGREKAA
jgi:hypothetical protein